MRIRFADPDDAPAVRDIYAPVVRDTAISFEETPPSVTDLREGIEGERYPWLVGEDTGGAVVGFAKASAHKGRGAYRWAVDVSAYVREDHRGRGVGTGLYEALLELLAAQGFRVAVAVIALPNPASVGLHESMGFERVGTFDRVGYKHGEWRDVGWWQLSLGERSADPDPPRSANAVADSERVAAAFERGAAAVEE